MEEIKTQCANGLNLGFLALSLPFDGNSKSLLFVHIKKVLWNLSSKTTLKKRKGSLTPWFPHYNIFTRKILSSQGTVIYKRYKIINSIKRFWEHFLSYIHFNISKFLLVGTYTKQLRSMIHFTYVTKHRIFIMHFTVISFMHAYLLLLYITPSSPTLI